ncbi:MAG: DNA-methyltransferase [bacterium]
MNVSKGTFGKSEWTIYNGSCIDVMAEHLGSQYIDCIVTSPPYWDRRAYGGKTKKDGNIAKWLYSDSGKPLDGEIGNGNNKEQYINNISDVFKLSYKVLKKNKFMFINIGNQRSNFEFVDFSHQFIIKAKEAGFVHRDTVIWIKRNPTPAGNHKKYYLANAWEYVLVFTKGKPKSINYENYMKIDFNFKCKKCEAENYIEKEIRPNYFYSNIGCFGRKRIPFHNHAAIFPLEVPKFCLRIATSPGDIVLDPFVGSGTTLIAGFEQELNTIGIELVPEIYQNVVSELKQLTI